MVPDISPASPHCQAGAPGSTGLDKYRKEDACLWQILGIWPHSPAVSHTFPVTEENKSTFVSIVEECSMQCERLCKAQETSLPALFQVEDAKNVDKHSQVGCFGLEQE